MHAFVWGKNSTLFQSCHFLCVFFGAFNGFKKYVPFHFTKENPPKNILWLNLNFSNPVAVLNCEMLTSLCSPPLISLKSDFKSCQDWHFLLAVIFLSTLRFWIILGPFWDLGVGPKCGICFFLRDQAVCFFVGILGSWDPGLAPGIPFLGGGASSHALKDLPPKKKGLEMAYLWFMCFRESWILFSTCRKRRRFYTP